MGEPSAESLKFMVIVDGYTGDVDDGVVYEVATAAKAKYRAWVAFKEAYGRGYSFLAFAERCRVRKVKP